jgi:hypothetical protein
VFAIDTLLILWFFFLAGEMGNATSENANRDAGIAQEIEIRRYLSRRHFVDRIGMML